MIAVAVAGAAEQVGSGTETGTEESAIAGKVAADVDDEEIEGAAAGVGREYPLEDDNKRQECLRLVE